MGRGHDHKAFAAADLIPFGDEITKAVEDFAHGQHLECESYYHDLPLWIVREAASKRQKIRRVQVNAYLVSTTPYISLVPSISVLVGNDKMLVPKRCQAIRFKMGEVVKRRRLDEEEFKARLQDAWKKASALKPPSSQMLEVSLSGTN